MILLVTLLLLIDLFPIPPHLMMFSSPSNKLPLCDGQLLWFQVYQSDYQRSYWICLA